MGKKKALGSISHAAAEKVPSYLHPSTSTGLTSFAELTRAVLGGSESLDPEVRVEDGSGDGVREQDLPAWEEEACGLLRKSLKRDETTRVKTLMELRGLLIQDGVREGGQVFLRSVFQSVLRRWLLEDDATKVREGGLKVLEVIVQKFRNATQPFLLGKGGDAVPIWLCLMDDSAGEVRNLAKLSFQDCFPREETRRRILDAKREDILRSALHAFPEDLRFLKAVVEAEQYRSEVDPHLAELMEKTVAGKLSKKASLDQQRILKFLTSMISCKDEVPEGWFPKVEKLLLATFDSAQAASVEVSVWELALSLEKRRRNENPRCRPEFEDNLSKRVVHAIQRGTLYSAILPLVTSWQTSRGSIPMIFSTMHPILASLAGKIQRDDASSALLQALLENVGKTLELDQFREEKFFGNEERCTILIRDPLSAILEGRIGILLKNPTNAKESFRKVRSFFSILDVHLEESKSEEMVDNMVSALVISVLGGPGTFGLEFLTFAASDSKERVGRTIFQIMKGITCSLDMMEEPKRTKFLWSKSVIEFHTVLLQSEMREILLPYIDQLLESCLSALSSLDIVDSCFNSNICLLAILVQNLSREGIADVLNFLFQNCNLIGVWTFSNALGSMSCKVEVPEHMTCHLIQRANSGSDWQVLWKIGWSPNPGFSFSMDIRRALIENLRKELSVDLVDKFLATRVAILPESKCSPPLATGEINLVCDALVLMAESGESSRYHDSLLEFCDHLDVPDAEEMLEAVVNVMRSKSLSNLETGELQKLFRLIVDVYESTLHADRSGRLLKEMIEASHSASPAAVEIIVDGLLQAYEENDYSETIWSDQQSVNLILKTLLFSRSKNLRRIVSQILRDTGLERVINGLSGLFGNAYNELENVLNVITEWIPHFPLQCLNKILNRDGGYLELDENIFGCLLVLLDCCDDENLAKLDPSLFDTTLDTIENNPRFAGKGDTSRELLRAFLVTERLSSKLVYQIFRESPRRKRLTQLVGPAIRPLVEYNGRDTDGHGMNISYLACTTVGLGIHSCPEDLSDLTWSSLVSATTRILQEHEEAPAGFAPLRAAMILGCDLLDCARPIDPPICRANLFSALRKSIIVAPTILKQEHSEVDQAIGKSALLKCLRATKSIDLWRSEDTVAISDAERWSLFSRSLIQDSEHMLPHIMDILRLLGPLAEAPSMNEEENDEDDDKICDQWICPALMELLKKDIGVISGEGDIRLCLFGWDYFVYLASQNESLSQCEILKERSMACHAMASRFIKLRPELLEKILHGVCSLLHQRSLGVGLLESAKLCLQSIAREFPTSTRRWFTDTLSRAEAKKVESTFQKFVTPALVEYEMKSSKMLGESKDDESSGDLRIKAMPSAREVSATYTLSDVNLTITLRLPDCYPLRMVEVEVDKHSAMSDTISRKTLLGIPTHPLRSIYSMN